MPNTYGGKEIDEYIKALGGLGVTVLPNNVFQEPLAGVYHFCKAAGKDVDGKKVLVIDIGGFTLDVIRGTVEHIDQAYRISVSGQIGEKIAGSRFDAVVKAELLEQMKSKGLDVSSMNVKDELMVAKKAVSIKERLS
ncbi:MAG: hypothetical protein J5674_00150, partial [Candidatus Methanomethylophilaceae archaeon]|nr:hypothetical protein [Candidatus Methanomethylophilaceae archaeon]